MPGGDPSPREAGDIGDGELPGQVVVSGQPGVHDLVQPPSFAEVAAGGVGVLDAVPGAWLTKCAAWPAIGPWLATCQKTQQIASHRCRGSSGSSRPVLSARYRRMAPDSNNGRDRPPGPSWSMMAGTLPFGLIFR